MRFPLFAALAALTLLAIAQPASAETVWLCKPGARNNPCERSLTATRIDPAGARQGTERIRIAKRAPVDCFYVYPTVSDQKTSNANRRIDPPLRSIAYFQASRFAQTCRVYAPVYRQLTLAGISGTAARARRPIRARPTATCSHAGRCVNDGGANSLRIEPLGGARRLTPVPDATWGLHLSDVNLPLGDLTALVQRQAAESLGD